MNNWTHDNPALMGDDELSSYLMVMRKETEDAASDRLTIQDRSARRYKGQMYDAAPKRGRSQFTLNHITPAMISDVSAILAESINPTGEAWNSGAPCRYFLSQTAAAMAGRSPGETSREVYESLIPLTRARLDPTGRPLPPLLTETDVVKVDDDTTAAFLEDVIQLVWHLVKGEQRASHAALVGTVLGEADTVVSWDSVGRLPRLTYHEPSQLRVDPVAVSLDDARYVALDQYISIRQAEVDFPDIIDKLKPNENNQPSAAFNEIMSRQLAGWKGSWADSWVCVQTYWIRDVVVPMTLDEAIETGDLVVNPVWTLPDGSLHDGPTFELAHEAGVDTYTADPMTDPGATRLQPGKAIFSASGEHVSPLDDPTNPPPGWPGKRVVYQVQVLGTEVVDRRPCKWDTYPGARFVNIPELFGTHGYGEPERMEDPQRLVGELASTAVDHVKFNTFPEKVMTKRTYRALQRLGDMHSRPDRLYALSEEEMKYLRETTGGSLYIQQQAPPLPVWLPEFTEQARRWTDQTGNNQDVSQGRLPVGGASLSGRAIESLQAAARAPLAYRSKQFAAYLSRLFDVLSQTVIRLFEDSDWQKLMREYEPAILAAFVERLKSGFRYQMKVDIAAGGMNRRERDAERATQLFTMGLMDPRAVLVAFGVKDPDGVLEAAQRWKMGQTPQAAMQPTPTAAPGGQPTSEPTGNVPVG